MHRYMRAIGFSQLKDRRELEKLIRGIIIESKDRELVSLDDEGVLSMFYMECAEDMGIAVCGQFDADNKYTYDYYYPYLRGTGISSYEDVSIERQAEKESYAGVCDDIKVGVSLIFYLQNMIPYLKALKKDLLPVSGTSLTLSALSVSGVILMPLQKEEKDKIANKKRISNRNHLLSEARRGDEAAIESLTLEDMDIYTSISRKIADEDIYTLVDTYFMPYGIECDQYSILGEICEIRETKNSLTNEEIYLLTLSCNDLQFDVGINKIDLLGQPEIGRRFKGTIWMQGFVNFPE